jgi:HPt (histidine-containing phosphotransfer) domain-containing protein
MIRDEQSQTRPQESTEATPVNTARAKRYTIVSDSQSALRAIASSAANSGQAIVQHILEQLETLKKQQVRVRLCWVSGHAGNAGNEAADQLAKRAVNAREDHNFRTPLSWYRKEAYQAIEREWRNEWVSSVNGKHLKRIDDGLPNRRALRLYGSLTRHETYLFTQLLREGTVDGSVLH